MELALTTLQAGLLINEQVDKAPEDDPSSPYRVRNQGVLGEMPEAVKLCLEGGRDEMHYGGQMKGQNKNPLSREGSRQANPGIL